MIKKVFYEKIYLFFFLLYKKMDNTTYYKRNKEKILNRAKDYYENDKRNIKRASKK